MQIGSGPPEGRQKGVSHCGPCQMFSYEEVGRFTLDHK